MDICRRSSNCCCNFKSSLKSNKARELAVKGLASGMQVKDNVEATVTSIKEDAQDVYAEAVEKSKAQ